MRNGLIFALLFLAACTAGTELEACAEGQVMVDGTCQDIFGEPESVTVLQVPDGLLAMPAEEGDYPGVVMIHEWWGLNENIRDMAVSLADQGYMVYAIDLYEGKVAEDAETAMQLSSSLDQDAATEKMRSAVRYLRDRGADRVASLGWCFGGAQSLQLSLAEELDATIIYYGQLETEPSALEVISGPVLGIFGENDTVVPVADVLQFKAALDSIGVESQVHIYPGVGHAFANPTGDNFASEETQDAWNKTLDFLDENLNRPRITESQRTFSITGENFRFMMDGQENPTITVNQGDTVRIEFKSNQGFHDWVLDEFDARTEQVSDGGTTVVEFVADEAGEFEYYCSVGQHRQMGMVGRFIVQ